MTAHETHAHAPTEAPAAVEHTHHPNYTRIYLILLVLLTISVLGPTLEIKIVTLITAFGVAVVKAYLVVKNFMHINVARRYVTYLVATCLVFMMLFFAGVAPDVMQAEGSGWEKPIWKAAASGADHSGDPHQAAGAHP